MGGRSSDWLTENHRSSPVNARRRRESIDGCLPAGLPDISARALSLLDITCQWAGMLVLGMASFGNLPHASMAAALGANS